MVHGDLAALDGVGQLEAVLGDIAALERRLQSVPLWRPAGILLKQVDEGRRLIAGMQARLSRRLVVTIVGPSGSGKSTLLNALAGVDELSATGHDRPTTRQPIALPMMSKPCVSSWVRSWIKACRSARARRPKSLSTLCWWIPPTPTAWRAKRILPYSCAPSSSRMC
jgi:hypothetical protein